jgi:molybdate transport system substrate-binding protein
MQNPADHPQRLIVLSTGAYKAALDEILVLFTRETGCETEAVYDSATAVGLRIEAGEPFGIAISTAGIMAALSAKNFFSGANHQAGSNEVCIAFQKNSPPPAISTPEKLRATLLAAASISLSDPKHGGGSSKYFVDLLESLGLTAAISPKLVITAGGQGAVPVAAGRAAFGIAQTSEIAMLPGLSAAPFPASRVDYELGISSHHPHPASKGLAAFLAGPAGLAIRRKGGLEPQ